MKKVILSVLLMLFSIVINAQSEGAKDSTESNLRTKLKLAEARKLFYDNNVRAALVKYREILEENQTNLTANVRMAECYYSLKNYKFALKYAEKAWGLSSVHDQDLVLIYAQCLHRVGRLDEALEKFELYKSNASRADMIAQDIQTQIDQCNLAKLLIKHPLEIEIKNFGRQINSKNDDYAPAITADGKTIYFTSRRDNIENAGRTDELGDHKYFEDIYYTSFSDSLGEWEKAELIPGRVNTQGHDAVLSVSPDGSTLYVYKNNEDSYGDIFITRKSKEGNKWREPKPLEKPVNSTFFESSCSITADGKYLYFVSERQEGYGQGDIYVCEKITSTEWTKPINLGAKINTKSDEKFVFITPDGKTLYFSSDGHPGMGSYDIFRSEKTAINEWTSPTNIGYPINSVNEESTFSISGDLSKFFISAEYSDSEGERDIYQINIKNALNQFQNVANSYRGIQTFEVKSNADGEPLKNAVVRISDDGDGHFIAKEKVNDAGSVNFTLILNKLYNYEVEADGHKSSSGVISIASKEISSSSIATASKTIELIKK